MTAKYDVTFDSSGNDISHGIMNSMSGGWKKITGSASNEQLSPPTDAELRSRLLNDVCASDRIPCREYQRDLRKSSLPSRKDRFEEGDKQATAGLWQRALETYETAPQLHKPEDDAYRLYNIGVAYEALAYKAEDQKSAMKFLDQAAINYGKAIDAKPTEKYFLDPQKRIETAIAHYKRLEDEENERERAAAAEKAKKARSPGGEQTRRTECDSRSQDPSNPRPLPMRK